MSRQRFPRARFTGSLSALAVAPLAARVGAAESFTMRCSTSDVATHPFTVAAIHFAQAVNRRSNGQVKIDVYPSGQIVAQAGIAEALSSGVVDFAVQSSAIMSPLVPRLQVLDFPFLFKDYAAAFRVLDGAVGDELAGDLSAKGIQVLTWGIGGFKEISTISKVVNTPEDMRGIRMRVQNAAISVATYQAMGAIPITIDNTEIFVALQNHTVDAIDINLNAVTGGKMYTVIKHCALAHLIVAVEPLYGSRRRIEALPASLQKIVREEGKATTPFWRSLTARQTATDIQTLKDNGVAFTEPQYAPFRKAVEPVYTSFGPRVGADLLQRVGRISGA